MFFEMVMRFWIGAIQHVSLKDVLTVCVHFVDHVLQLSLCGVLAQRAHDCAQFFGGDGTIAVLVKE